MSFFGGVKRDRENRKSGKKIERQGEREKRESKLNQGMMRREEKKGNEKG